MNLYKKIMKNEKFSQNIVDINEKQEFISTGIITLNLLFSGQVDGGIPIGKISMISAPSTLGKSLIGYACMKNFQKKVPDGICIFLDIEKAFDYKLAEKYKIDLSKEKFIPIKENKIEEIEYIITDLTNDLTSEEQKKILFVVDSWAGLVTSKTLKDAVAGKDVADMTEPKKKNRLAKIFLGIDSTFFVINGVYDNIGGYGDPLSIPGARRIYYNAQTVVLSRSKSKDKQGEDLNGVVIKAITHKSRIAKEKSDLEYRIKYNGGLDTFYGLLKDGLESGVISKPKNGRYSRTHIENDKEWKEKDIYCSDFWLPVFQETNFQEYLENKYSFKNTKIDIADLDINFKIRNNLEEN